MANRANGDGLDDDDDDDDHALFVNGGLAVKFCFHKSVTQGRDEITRNVERNGGTIIDDERRANVLLVDEQEDITFLRRSYYSSTERYKLSLYVEPRGFVQHCIRSGEYRHIGPVKQGMPGRARGSRQRVAFTEKDREHLAFYLATRCPTGDGRMGSNAYRELEGLAQRGGSDWAWARRHTFHSWREHYKMNPRMMDEKINYYLERLRDVGHHFGHDPRRHDHRILRREEEEEEADEEGGQRQRMEGGRRKRRKRGRRHERERKQARRQQDLITSDEEEGAQQGEEEPIAIQGLQRVKRQRANTHQQRDAQTKRARVSEASLEEGERQVSDVNEDPGEDHGEESEEIEGDDLFGDRGETSDKESEEIEGDDLFGDRAYEESRVELDDQEIEFPMPYSPRAVQGPVDEQEGAPLSTQATLIASPGAAEKAKEPTPPPSPTPTKVGEVHTPALQSSLPQSQQTVVATRERVAVQRARVRGASAQPGPSLSRERKVQGSIAMAGTEAPYRNTRARSRSVEPRAQSQVQPQLRSGARSQRRQDQAGRRKGMAKEEALVPIEEDVQVEEVRDAYAAEEEAVTNGPSARETFEDEMVVEELLEESVGSELSEDEGSEGSLSSRDEDDENIMSEIPRSQEVGSEPSDSDDAETHGSLLRGGVREGTVRVDVDEGGDEGDAASEEEGQDGDSDVHGESVGVDDASESALHQNQEQEQDIGIEIDSEDSDEDDADSDAERIERMAMGSLHARPPPPSEPGVTRSMVATETQGHRMQTRRQAQSQMQSQSQVSPRRTRSGRERAIPTGFPSPGTKARAVVDRFQEEEKQMPYKPPVGSRAARVVRGKGRRE